MLAEENSAPMNTQPTTSALRRQPLWLVRAMTTMYCKRIHRGGQLCSQCAALLAFETEREQQCCKSLDASSCKECRRQCYPAATRLEINHIVRWATPKSRWRKPLWVAKHYVTSILE